MDALRERLLERSAALAPALARRAFELGLAVTRTDGVQIPIPLTLTPVVLPREVIQQRHLAARRLAQAGVKMARYILKGPRREVLLSALSPLERELAEATFERVELLAITRVDFFLSRGRPFALELNAT